MTDAESLRSLADRMAGDTLYGARDAALVRRAAEAMAREEEASKAEPLYVSTEHQPWGPAGPGCVLTVCGDTGVEAPTEPEARRSLALRLRRTAQDLEREP